MGYDSSSVYGTVDSVMQVITWGQMDEIIWAYWTLDPRSIHWLDDAPWWWSMDTEQRTDAEELKGNWTAWNALDATNIK